MRHKRTATLAMALCLSFAGTTALHASARIAQCDWPAQVRNVVEPWEQATRTFANGKVRIVWVDTGGEPVCCSSHLVILAPDPKDELGLRQCRMLTGESSGLGFLSIDIKGTAASYDPGKGLLLSIPVKVYVDGVDDTDETHKVRINQATGDVALE